MWHSAALTGLVDIVYPPRCVACRAHTETPHGLCGACWREMGFVSGAVCDACGAPVPAGQEGPGRLLCDGCVREPPAWGRGRAAFLYDGCGRRLVLALKHADRLDLVRPFAAWMRRAGAELLRDATLVAPVPMHRLRLLRRRYNQAAELARAIGRSAGLPVCPGLLVRHRGWGSQEGRSRAERFARMRGAIAVAAGRSGRLAGARVLLIDDVMTSGATLSAAAEACLAGGAAAVDVLVAARVVREAAV
jgi:predicted amidophosphoribosyltransferase